MRIISRSPSVVLCHFFRNRSTPGFTIRLPGGGFFSKCPLNMSYFGIFGPQPVGGQHLDHIKPGLEYGGAFLEVELRSDPQLLPLALVHLLRPRAEAGPPAPPPCRSGSSGAASPPRSRESRRPPPPGPAPRSGTSSSGPRSDSPAAPKTPPPGLLPSAPGGGSPPRS